MHLQINDRLRPRKLTFFTNYEIHMKYDSLGSPFKFDFKFDPFNFEHKEMACIGHVHLCTIWEGNQRLMTGYVPNIDLVDKPATELVTIQGYSLPGFLGECEIPLGPPEKWIDVNSKRFRNIAKKRWPQSLQSNMLTLQQIVQTIINPFGLQMVVDDSVRSEMNSLYEETTAKEKQTAKSYICELATQKNVVVTDNVYGNVVFTRLSSNKKSIYHFERGKTQIPGTEMHLSFNGMGMHSHIKAYSQQDANEEIEDIDMEPLMNPYIPIVFRPHVGVQTSGDQSDVETTAKNILAKELRNVTLTIDTDRWGIGDKKVIFMPGQIISVTNPYVYLYEKSDWFIEEVYLRGNAEQTVAKLKCVRPEVYNGATPKYLWKGYNLHLPDSELA